MAAVPKAKIGWTVVRLERGKFADRAVRFFLGSRPKPAEIIAAAEKVKSETREAFQDRYGDRGRDMVLYLGWRHCGFKLVELGQAVGGLDDMRASMAIHRLGRRLEKDSALRTALNHCQINLAM